MKCPPTDEWINKWWNTHTMESYSTVKRNKSSMLRDILCSWMRRFNIVRMSILLKMIYGFNTIPIRIPAGFFVQVGKLVLKFRWKCKGSRIVWRTPKKINRSWRANITGYWQKAINESMEQNTKARNRATHTWPTDLTKAQKHCHGERIAFQQMALEQSDMHAHLAPQRKELRIHTLH